MNQAGINQSGASRDIAESLSAGIDGELRVEQWRFLLRRLDHDPVLQESWSRYHVARDALRRQLTPLASAGFAARVSLAIEQEAGAVAPSQRRHHWLRWTAGGAIAASVAAVALMVSQPAGDTDRLAVSADQQRSPQIADAARANAPAEVPPWLSGNSAGLLSQQASATAGMPFDQARSAYARRLSVYPPMHRYRTLDNNDGSYLLLLDPDQQSAPVVRRQAASSAQ